MFRHIKNGKVSAHKSHDGQMEIDTSELLRVFGALLSKEQIQDKERNRAIVSPPVGATASSVAQQIEIERLKAQLEAKVSALAMAEDRITELKEQRDRIFTLFEQQTRLLAEEEG